MNSETLDTDYKARTSISLSPEVLAKGQERAREVRRSFSNYIEVLIEADARQPEAKIPIWV